jgi:hypothetical protein
MGASPLLPRVPHDGPAWLGLRSSAALALAWPGLAVGACVLLAAWSSAPTPWGVLSVALATIPAQVMFARWMVRPRADLEAALVAVAVQGVIAAACGLALVSTELLQVRSLFGRGPLPADVAMIKGVVYGLVVGMLVGTWQGALALFVADRRRTPSLDLRDRVVAGLGLLIALPASVVLAILLVVWRSAALIWLPFAVVAPLLVAAAARANMRARRRWVADVADGRVPGWRVVDQPGHANLRVLVRTRVALEPFRDADAMEPVAVVHESALRAR